MGLSISRQRSPARCWYCSGSRFLAWFYYTFRATRSLAERLRGFF